jgi:hypothetical protein
MKICLKWFNIYLMLLMFFFVTTGCDSVEKMKKTMTTLRLHLEVPKEDTGRSGEVKVTHENILVNVEKEPFLTEGDVAHATVVDTMGGFAIQVVFDSHATTVLDMVTTSHKGSRIAILTQFPLSHWVAAPLITKRIANGVFTFTPDVTREEADRIVSGLNKVVEKRRKEDKLF